MKQQIAEQLSLFDIEIPSINEKHKISAPPLDDLPKRPFNMARVPDEEFIVHNTTVENLPSVAKILKLLEKGSFKVGRHEFLSDVFECGAITISNQFDKRQAKRREERYLQIVKGYDRDMLELLVKVFAEIYTLLSQQTNPAVGFNDYLGELYMRSETSNKYAGQFFTPYCVSKACAAVTINEAVVNEYIEQDKILTLNEPTCGAGGMILAAADILYNQYHFNISRNLVVECSDIDSRCVHMTYLQLSLAGIPAVIFKRNTLTMETWERWETPAYIMQYMRFRNVFKGTASDTKIGDAMKWQK